MSKFTLLIRCDANEKIATGHMKRCMSIAKAAVNLGINVIFAVASDSSVSYLKDIYPYVKFDNEFDEAHKEMSKMEKLLSELKPNVLLIDSYFVSPDYMAKMRKYTKVAYIDDLYERIWPADIIINYGVNAKEYPYLEDYKESVKLLGCDYMPINEIYHDAKEKRIKDIAENVLVVSGGSDENHVMLETLKAIVKADSSLNYKVICGAFNRDVKELKLIADERENITVLESLPNLKDAIDEADIIVTAGGTTLYEMAIMGCPGIIYKLADNQTENIKGFINNGIALYAGDLSKDIDKFSFDNFVNMIEELSKDKEMRMNFSKKGRKLVDGKGAYNLIKALEKI